ncbi:hypothetical protein [Tateyamaria sp. SN3-11]|uniref:hypothetical protein n=1 Tax=Tateyamaria sp. SN3-11 TaxID=3092147 RepID=UPI0039EA3551
MSVLISDRFTAQSGHLITVQVPETDAPRLITAITTVDPLAYGDYDSVTFASQPGTQSFRALGTGRNAATADVVTVPCVELSFFCAGDPGPVIKAIYAAHPYEEPVIFASPTARTLHIRGLDEDNPNKFWNRPTPDWVPEEHR